MIITIIIDTILLLMFTPATSIEVIFYSKDKASVKTSGRCIT